MKINFFLNVLSIHQAPLIRKLSEKYAVNVFYEEPLSKERKELGWYVPDFGSSKVLLISDVNESCLLQSMTTNTVNIFSGLYAYKEIQKWLDKSIKTSASNYIQMESLILNDKKAILRKFKYKLLAFKYNKHITGIFSQGGKTQLEKLGFKNVYDFAYFIDKVNNVYTDRNNETKFIYLGALSERKNILDLVSNISEKEHYILDIYGSELDVSLEHLNSVIGSKKNVNYKGVLQNNHIACTLKKYDYLVLPSKAEGWGAVIVEALLCGVGVVVTDVAGVTSYIYNKFSYGVYIEDFSEIHKVVDLMKELIPLLPNERKKIQEEAFFLSSEYGAELLIRYIL